MAITKVAQYSSTPTAVSDYQAQNSHLQAMINKANGSMSILNQTSTTSVPYIALGTYIMMGGTLYVVDTSNYTILGSLSSGSNYIRLTVSGDNLIATWVQTITSYSWNNIYNYYSDGTNALLPYVINYDSTNYYISKFNQFFTGKVASGGDILISRVFGDVESTSYTAFSFTYQGRLNGTVKLEVQGKGNNYTGTVYVQKNGTTIISATSFYDYPSYAVVATLSDVSFEYGDVFTMYLKSSDSNGTVYGILNLSVEEPTDMLTALWANYEGRN